MTEAPSTVPPPTERKKARHSHGLYIAVIVAVVLGITVGLIWPEQGKELKWLSDLFLRLIRMVIPPVIFCTIVLGVGSVRKAAQVGRVGGLALGYFMAMSTFALAIGLLVGNLIHPGSGLHLTAEAVKEGKKQAENGHGGGTTDFILGIVPDTMLSALTVKDVLPTLFVALLVGFALQGMGKQAEPILAGVKHLERLVFRVMAMVMWMAPVGAFGAMAYVVGTTGVQALKSLMILMGAFYLTCVLFIICVLGPILWLGARINIFRLLKYLGAEYLLLVSTSSSETALPRLIAKMEHLGVSRQVVGITVPTGYSFNLDGTAIYLTMASLFIADGLGKPLSVPEQLGLLVFMIIASKGAAGVSGAGLATLAAGLQSHRPELVDGVGVIQGIDRFMSEARAVTNFTGNAVATVLLGRWVGELDRERAEQVLAGRIPFDNSTLVDTDHEPRTDEAPYDRGSDHVKQDLN